MKKKIFSVLLVPALAISTLAGCNNKSDKGTENQKQTEVTEATETAEEKTAELNDIAEGVKNMATAIQLPQFYVDRKMKCHAVTATKLSNIDLYIKNGKLMEGVRTIE